MNKDRKKRIAFIGTGVGLPAEYGEDRGMPMLSALLERLAVDFDVVIYSLIRVNEVRVPAGVSVRQVSSGSLHAYFKYIGLLISFVFDHLRRPFSVINAISAYPAGRMAVVLGTLLRKPVVVHLIGSEAVAIPEIGYGDILNPRLKRITQWVCARATVVVVQTEFQKQIVENNLGRLPNMVVMSRRVDVDKFTFRQREISFPVSFLHVATFQAVKDQETLFKAFGKIAGRIDCTLTVVGAGYEHADVRTLLKAHGIADKVTVAGLVSHSMIGNYFNAAHILLHTSRYESLCGVVQEAMASGVPVCGTRVGILSDIGDDYAVIVPVGDAGNLALQTLELVDNALQYSRLQSNARKYIEEHDANWSAKQYKELYYQLSSKKSDDLLNHTRIQTNHTIKES